MSYDPIAYWQDAGVNPEALDHESHFRRTEVFARQEDRLMRVLDGLDFASILEVGCGWGRITKLVHERWPDVSYLAVDLSAVRLDSARQKAPGVTFAQSTIEDFAPAAYGRRRHWDLVLAVETLMHVRPADIGATVERLLQLAGRSVVSLDWSVALGDTPIAPWNFLHPYADLYGERLVLVETIGLQAIYVAAA